MRSYMAKLGLMVGASCFMLLTLGLVYSLGWLPPATVTYDFGGEPAPLDDGPTTIVVESEMVADELAKYDEEASGGGLFVYGDGEEARLAWQEQLRAEVSQPFAADYPVEYIDWLLATSGQTDLSRWDLGPERVEYWNSLQSGHKELIAKTVIARENSQLHPHLWRFRVMLYKDQELVKRVLYLEEAITEQEARMAELQRGNPAEVEGGDDPWAERRDAVGGTPVDLEKDDDGESIPEIPSDGDGCKHEWVQAASGDRRCNQCYKYETEYDFEVREMIRRASEAAK